MAGDPWQRGDVSSMMRTQLRRYQATFDSNFGGALRTHDVMLNIHGLDWTSTSGVIMASRGP